MISKKNRKKNISKVRIFITFIFFVCFVSILGFNCYNNFYDIYLLKDKKDKLNKELVILLEKEETLESDIKKLEDPEYIAKYVREKYLYSKDGEIIIRMDDEEKE